MNVTRLTQELVAIPSINPNSLADPTRSAGEAAMMARVKQVLEDLGANRIETWDTYPDRPSVCGYFDFDASQTLIFDTHLDTVPVDGMTIDPFAAELREGRIYGRGSCDMKGPMAAMLCALAAQKASSTPAKYNVLFAATADEEAGFRGVISFLDRLDASLYAPLAGVVVAEPTCLSPVIAHKGTCRWAISTAGVAAHSSRPFLGENAIYKMAPVITALETYAAELMQRPAHASLGTPTLSLGTIHGGSAVNVVPDHCTVQVDRRLIPGETPHAASIDLARALQGLDVHISEPTITAPPMETPADNWLVNLALSAAGAQGISAQAEYAHYCTNGSFYPPLGLPIIVFGPGDIAQAHTKDEWISVEMLEAGVAAYQALLL